jgi:hypothetical protein
MLVSEHPQIVALAREAQNRLSRFSGLHMTPLKWLHMTALIAGTTDEITTRQIHQMAEAASRLLAGAPPITITLGRILYHPEAIMLAVKPPDGLLPVLNAARTATHEVTGTYGRPGNRSPWTSHITLSYSTGRQSAGPIISTLGHELPACQAQISTVSLVIQRGPERQWDWHPMATTRFGQPA